MKETNNTELESGIALPLMEDFYTIQGEGYHTGKAAYFMRVGGCDVGCHWCDVKESWDASLHPLTSIKKMVENALAAPARAVVVTGGEPSKYNLVPLTKLLKEKGFKTYLETSGSDEITGSWDWVCLSPKKTAPTLPQNFEKANELKVIIHNKDDFRWAEKNAESCSNNTKLYLQPEWSKAKEMIPLLVEYVMANPKWEVSLQTHKYLNIP